MPSPFPGMDPYVESQRWSDFHTRFVTQLSDVLVPRVRPRYIVEVEQYVYVARSTDDPEHVIEPDLGIVDRSTTVRIGSGGRRATATLVRPKIRTLPMPKRRRQKFLTIRNRAGLDVVTVIEVLSPWNKAAGDGRAEYLTKRANVLASFSHLVEIDLLRGGERLPTVEPLPRGDYFGFVVRRPQRPKVEVYVWKLRDAMPPIPVPLAEG